MLVNTTLTGVSMFSMVSFSFYYYPDGLEGPALPFYGWQGNYMRGFVGRVAQPMPPAFQVKRSDFMQPGGEVAINMSARVIHPCDGPGACTQRGLCTPISEYPLYNCTCDEGRLGLSWRHIWQEL
jgi:hypothetical protein